MFTRFIFIAVLSSLLWGCSSAPIKYQNAGEQNLTINLRLDKRGGIFTKIKVVSGVNDLDSNCEPHYKGMVELTPGKNEIGLKPGVLTFIQVDVAHNGTGINSVTNRGTMLKPESGKNYQIDISYIDNMYDFTLYEVLGTQRKQLKLMPLSNCRKE